ncbi:MAG TPA: hypothetical protein PLC40_04125 [Candidatus Hydrogenedentes bacterium]|nr:hypothetical protein [Candidatus Hydrogenedentota bacterium]
MPYLHPQYMYDQHGALQSVILNIDEFRSLLECAGIPLESTVAKEALYLKDLGWPSALILDARTRLRNLEEDWDTDGMEAYDRL